MAHNWKDEHLVYYRGDFFVYGAPKRPALGDISRVTRGMLVEAEREALFVAGAFFPATEEGIPLKVAGNVIRRVVWRLAEWLKGWAER